MNIQIKKRDNSETVSLKKMASSRMELVSPANSGVYQPKCDINHILSHLNKKSSTLQMNLLTKQGESNMNNVANTNSEDVLSSLMNKRNKLIQSGKYTDGIDEVIMKIKKAKKRNFRVLYI